MRVKSPNNATAWWQTGKLCPCNRGTRGGTILLCNYRQNLVQLRSPMFRHESLAYLPLYHVPHLGHYTVRGLVVGYQHYKKLDTSNHANCILQRPADAY